MKNQLLLLVLIPLCMSFLSTCEKTTDLQGSENGEFAINLKVHKEVLDNGLNVLIVENSALPIYSLYSFFDVGGRFEEAGTTGATHFLEHMLFKKTKNNPSGYFSQFVNDNGGNSNAYTTFDNTVYYEELPISTLEKMLELEAERLENLVLDPLEFEKERAVVLEERKMRYENRPRGQIYAAMMKTMFKGTPYGGSVIGEKEDVQNLTREKMMDFYNKYYAPNNYTMVLVGDVKADEAFDLINKTVGKLKKNNDLELIKEKFIKKYSFKPQTKLPQVISLKGQSITPMFSLSFPGLKAGEEESYALDFVASILGEGTSSYLTQEFVTSKRPKLTSVYAANYNLLNAGVFYIQGQLLEKQSLKKFRRSLYNAIKRSCSEAITERTVQKTKNKILIDYYSGIRNNSGLASFLGNNEFYLGDYKAYEKELRLYNSMTVEKVKNACRKYLVTDQRAFISIWNKHKRTKL